MQVEELQRKVAGRFRQAFGRTPLKSRLEDILNEAIELSRFTDMANLKEESGDLLCSLLALFNECDMNVEKAVDKTLAKIDGRRKQYDALGRKTRVALLGGAFDPPTLGHLAVSKFVLDTSREFDEIWWVPCWRHMFGKDLTESAQRMTMCHRAVDDARIKVFDYEIVHQLKGETFHFLTKLLDDPNFSEECSFSYIIGMDNANHFDKWVNYEQLENMIRFVVVSRCGEEPDARVDWYLKPPHIYLRPETPLPDTASSRVRNALATGAAPLYTQREVDPKVWEYIKNQQLYKKQK